MTTKKLTDPQHYEDIADSIRAKNGSSDTYAPSQMANEISALPTGSDTMTASLDGDLDTYTYAGDKTTFNEFEGSSINATTITFSLVTFIDKYAFRGNKSETMNFPALTRLANYSFDGCKILKEINMNVLTSLPRYAFQGCSELLTVNIPLVEEIQRGVFQNCTNIVELKVPSATNNCFTDGSYFNNCPAFTILDLGKNDSSSFTTIANGICSGTTNLTHVAIRRTTRVYLSKTISVVFGDCPLAQGTGYVYVPRNLITTYQAETNWSTLGAGQWRALEDYTVDGTITGDLDPSKI